MTPAVGMNSCGPPEPADLDTISRQSGGSVNRRPIDLKPVPASADLNERSVRQAATQKFLSNRIDQFLLNDPA